MTKSHSDNMDSTTDRAWLLRKAESIVCGDRNQEYGEPVENMSRTAAMFSAYLGDRRGTDMDSTDIAVFGIILKLGRLAHDAGSADSWLDVAGYASIGFEAAESAKSKKPQP